MAKVHELLPPILPKALGRKRQDAHKKAAADRGTAPIKTSPLEEFLYAREHTRAGRPDKNKPPIDMYPDSKPYFEDPARRGILN